MAENGTIAYVDTKPACNFHTACTADYDFRTSTGPWAYGCEAAYLENRMHPTLGVGKGQKLEVRSST